MAGGCRLSQPQSVLSVDLLRQCCGPGTGQTRVTSCGASGSLFLGKIPAEAGAAVRTGAASAAQGPERLQPLFKVRAGSCQYSYLC